MHLLTHLSPFSYSISEHRLLERGKGKEESHLEMNQTHYYFIIFISYHHLHIPLEASAVCSGTVDQAKMLFLCYGWKPKMEIWPLLIKQSWSISDIKVYILFIIQQTRRQGFAPEGTPLQFSSLWSSLLNHENLSTENMKVKNDNTQNHHFWLEGCMWSSNIIMLIAKLYVLIPEAVSEWFASWWKDRGFLSALNHAVMLSFPAQDLWHLSRFDPSLSRTRQHRQWKLFNYTNKNAQSKPLMEAEQLYFQLFLSPIPLAALWWQSQQWRLHGKQA